MAIRINEAMPAVQNLKKEGIQVNPAILSDNQVHHLQIAVLNIMPTKEASELQFLRLLSNAPLDSEITFIRLTTHQYKCCSQDHLETYYKPFNELKNSFFDGLVITGAPLEHLEYEAVDYWQELTEIMDWSRTHIRSTLHVCWSAQAALYHHYGIPKYPLKQKLSGLYRHDPNDASCELTRGFGKDFFVPHSRYTEVRKADIERNQALKILGESDKAGVYLILAEAGRQVFITGHPEYDTATLAQEYNRDLKKNLNPKIPENYFPADDPACTPVSRWQETSNRLFSNWLKYYVTS